MLHCLKHVPVQRLIDRSYADEHPPTPLGALLGEASFGPTIDRRSVLLNDVRASMAEVTSDSVFANVSLMIGFTADEAGAFFSDTVHDRGVTVERMRATVGSLVAAAYAQHQYPIRELLLHHYRDWDGPLDDTAVLRSLIDLLGDALYAVPAFETGLQHAAHSTSGTFLYCFNFTTGRGGRTDATADPPPSRREAAWHGDDLAYIFGAPLAAGMSPFPAVYTKAEKTFAETILKFWINFIKTGSPNDPLPAAGHLPQTTTARLKGRPTDTTSPEWPEFEAERQEVMILDSESHSRRHFRASRFALWVNLIPKILRPDDSCADDPRATSSNTHPRPSTNQSRLLQVSSRPFCSTVSATGSTSVRTTTLHGQRALYPPPPSGTASQPTIATPAAAAAITAHRRSPIGEPSAERRGLRTTPAAQLATPPPHGDTLLRGSNGHVPVRGIHANGRTPLLGTTFGGGPIRGNDAQGGEASPHGHELKRVEPPIRTDVELTQDEGPIRGGPSGAGGGLALIVVVGVGCFLLALNVLLFLCVYRKQLRRWRERRKRRKATVEELEAKGELAEHSYGLRDTAAGRAVTNGPDTHFLTPIPSHHHLYCQMTSLQNSFHAAT